MSETEILRVFELGVKLIVFSAGFILVIYTLMSVIRQLILPRSDNVLITRTIFRNMFSVFHLLQKFSHADTYQQRDRLMAFFSPISLMVMVFVWMILVTVGFAMMYWALGVGDWYASYLLSGSSLLTLGFAPVMDWITMILTFAESAIGLILVALLISYLPTIYSAFSRREREVAMLEVPAGNPPSGITMIQRMYRNNGIEHLTDIYSEWEKLFSEMEESHTSQASLVFFRSPNGNRSWVTATGAVLDSIALLDSTVDMPRNIESVLCMRAGYICLQRICDYFSIPYNSDPDADDLISITREEFDEAYDELANQGVPVKQDRDQCWQDFKGWRVNYDTPLLRMAYITMAPYAPWTSDRSIPTRQSLGSKHNKADPREIFDD